MVLRHFWAQKLNMGALHMHSPELTVQIEYIHKLCLTLNLKYCQVFEAPPHMAGPHAVCMHCNNLKPSLYSTYL